MTFRTRASIQRGFDHLASRLDPILQTNLESILDGAPWADLLIELDHARGKQPQDYDRTALRPQLRILTEELGQYGHALDNRDGTVRILGCQLRVMCTRYSNDDELEVIDAWHVHDLAVALLEHFDDTRGVRAAKKLRAEVTHELVHERGITPTPMPTAPTRDAPALPSPRDGQDATRPSARATERHDTERTPRLGHRRWYFEPWPAHSMATPDVLDELPRKHAKEHLRSVASEIAEFEGPIHFDRLIALTAATFGIDEPTAQHTKLIARYLRKGGLRVCDDKFVWPSTLHPHEWNEFRPSDNLAGRPFQHISPVEIANAARFLRHRVGITDPEELETETLRTFGHERGSTGWRNHLDDALRSAKRGTHTT